MSSVTSLMTEASSFMTFTQSQILLCGALHNAARRTRPVPIGSISVRNDNFHRDAVEAPIPLAAEATSPPGAT